MAAPIAEHVASPSKPARLDLSDIQHFVFEDASWDFYKRMLKEVGNRPIRLTYDNGRLEIMAPMGKHEGPRAAIAQFISLLALEVGMPYRSYGSTTFKSRQKKKGLEPDACFYFKNQEKMAGRKNYNPRTDPPPDLAVEIDITSRSVKREPIYAALGVPELWRWRRDALDCRHLEEGRYVSRPRSLTFPFLEPAALARFVEVGAAENDLAAAQQFIAWVRTNGWGPSTDRPESGSR